MALHGNLEVNGQTIGYWSATRRDKDTKSRLPDEVLDYDWEVVVYATDSQPRGRWEGTLWHRFGDGALALAATVLRVGRDAQEAT